MPALEARRGNAYIVHVSYFCEGFKIANVKWPWKKSKRDVIRPISMVDFMSFITLNSTPHAQNCWLGNVINRESFRRWESGFISMTLIRHSYLVHSLSNYAMNPHTETDLNDDEVTNIVVGIHKEDNTSTNLNKHLGSRLMIRLLAYHTHLKWFQARLSSSTQAISFCAPWLSQQSHYPRH